MSLDVEGINRLIVLHVSCHRQSATDYVCECCWYIVTNWNSNCRVVALVLAMYSPRYLGMYTTSRFCHVHVLLLRGDPNYITTAYRWSPQGGEFRSIHNLT